MRICLKMGGQLMLKQVKIVLIIIVLLLIHISWAGHVNTVADADMLPPTDHASPATFNGGNTRPEDYHESGNDALRTGQFVTQLMILLISGLSACIAAISAAAARRSAACAQRSVEAATRRSLDVLDSTIEEDFGPPGFPPEKDFIVQFLNTGREVIHVYYSHCEANPTEGFHARVQSANIGRDAYLSNVESSIPIPPGLTVVVVVRVWFSSGTLREQSECHGKLCFDVIPCLDTGQRTLEINCKFYSRYRK